MTPPAKTKAGTHTIASLRLDIQSAMEGKLWLLLPEGFRDAASGLTYPLPTSRLDLQRLVAIPIPANIQNAGAKYVKRAIKEWSRRQQRRTSAVLDVANRQEKVAQVAQEFEKRISAAKSQVAQAVNEVRREAEQQIANLNDLFVLGRKGIEGQMRAHLAGEEWKGESISAHAFRECFRMVTQAVKGLGVPSDERKKAVETVMGEAAEALKSTRETLELAPGSKDPETEH